MTWWLLNSTRLAEEKTALKNFAAGVEWLQIGEWRANSDLVMRVDFQIDHGGTRFDFEMIYPSVFPDAPPMVYTDDRSRISMHQYGARGELCLEHRPDNWQPSITGADMIASCERLLEEEQTGSDTVVHARSAHVASLGRDLRSKFCRHLLTTADLEALNTLTEYVPKALSLRDRKAGSSFISSIVHIGDKDSPLWASDLVLPKGVADETGCVVRVPGFKKRKNISAEDLGKFLDASGLADLREQIVDGEEKAHLLIGDANEWELLWLYGKPSDRKVIPYTTVRVPIEMQRVPDVFQTLSEGQVAIVGCGSVGSKIAASLCRSGVGKFLLVDEDVFFPGNVVRNELDLMDVGAHKSYALRDRLFELNPRCQVKALRLSLGGQESSDSMAGALEALGECDLLVDATAEPVAFNMIASVSTRQKKPMIWCELFAGGIGGIVARARPDIDPVPISARTQIDVWCDDQGVEWNRRDSVGSYADLAEDGRPMIADDAEVAVIAAHAARFATDILARPEASLFPMSAYVIGLSSQWLFKQPFDTRPIDLLPEGAWGENIDMLAPEDLLELLKEHLTPKEGVHAAADPD
jgi:molybdopterin/thiamine biosynthesis adenylyltransferase/ubiquitin-protein ligase